MVKIEIDMEDFKEKMNNALEGIKWDIIESLQSKLTNEGGKDTGALSSSIPRFSKVNNNTVEISMLDYGKYVEFGSPPHMPPVDKLKGWARRKLGDEKLAWAVAMGIKKRGTRPHPFIRPTYNNELIPIIRQNLKESFK